MVDRRLRIAQYVFTVIGLGCAGWLTYTKYADGGVCGVSHGCTVVQTSPWSELFGIPVSLLGLIGYFGILALLTAPQRLEPVRLMLVVVTGVGFLFSMYMMYRAYITIDAFCPFCTTSAIMMTLLAITSTVRFVRGPDGATFAAVGLDDELDLEEDEDDDEDADSTDEEHAVAGDGPQGVDRT